MVVILKYPCIEEEKPGIILLKSQSFSGGMHPIVDSGKVYWAWGRATVYILFNVSSDWWFFARGVCH